jgi:catechol 2,3-dioxygenase-like lactoylglutathione lyase family enzyme
MGPELLDHVALWVSDRDAAAERAVEALDVHVVERNDRFTLVGADARRGKLTLFDGEGQREPGSLLRIGLRVSSRTGPAEVDLGDGLRLSVVERETDADVDLDHVALRVADPEASARRWIELGLQPATPTDEGVARVAVGGAFLELHPGEPALTERPLLNHLGVLVGSVDEQLAGAERLGVEIDDLVDEENTRALFVWGPDGVKLEYVEHKPTFSLT